MTNNFQMGVILVFFFDLTSCPLMLSQIFKLIQLCIIYSSPTYTKRIKSLFSEICEHLFKTFADIISSRHCCQFVPYNTLICVQFLKQTYFVHVGIKSVKCSKYQMTVNQKYQKGSVSSVICRSNQKHWSVRLQSVKRRRPI